MRYVAGWLLWLEWLTYHLVPMTIDQAVQISEHTQHSTLKVRSDILQSQAGLGFEQFERFLFLDYSKYLDVFQLKSFVQTL